MRLPSLNIRINNVDCVAIVSIRSPQSLLSKSFRTSRLKSTPVIPPIPSSTDGTGILNNEIKKSEFVVLYPSVNSVKSHQLSCSLCKKVQSYSQSDSSASSQPLSSNQQDAASSNEGSNIMPQCQHFRVIVVEEIIAAVQIDLEIPAGPQRFSVVSELPLGLDGFAACILGYDFFVSFDLHLDILGIFVDVWNKHAQLNPRTGLPLHPEKSSNVLLSKSNWHRNYVSQAAPVVYLTLGEADEAMQIANPQHTKAEHLDLLEKFPEEFVIDPLTIVPSLDRSCSLEREFGSTLGTDAKYWLECSLDMSREREGARIRSRATLPDQLTWRALVLSVSYIRPGAPLQQQRRLSMVNLYAAILEAPPLFLNESGKEVEMRCSRRVCHVIDRCTCLRIASN